MASGPARGGDQGGLDLGLDLGELELEDPTLSGEDLVELRDDAAPSEDVDIDIPINEDTVARADLERLLAESLDLERPAPPVARGSGAGLGQRSETLRYLLGAELGQVAAGTLFRAHDNVLNRDVALLLLAPGVAFDRARLERVQAELKHPDIVAVLEVGGQVQGRPYLALELVDGHMLVDELALSGRLKVLDAVRVVDQVLRALEHAHRKHIFHGDVRPANLVRTADGRVRLTGFALARAVGGYPGVHGTLEILSPERLDGAPEDARSDLYAAGVLLYQLLAGRLPFEGSRRERPPTPITELNPSVPRLLDTVLARSLEHDPGKRYVGAGDMRVPLEQLLLQAQHFQRLRPMVAPGATPRPVSGAASRTDPQTGKLVPLRAGDIEERPVKRKRDDDR